MRGHLEVVQALLTKGADMEAKNNSNKTALQLTPEASHAMTESSSTKSVVGGGEFLF
jgi:hypothetical protein